jgi:hypothetical protein
MSGISTGAAFEECADKLNDFVMTLEEYSHTVLAHALRAHLSGLLQALLAQGRWTATEVEAFLEELLDETLPE